MAKIKVLKEPVSGQKIYPVTTLSAVFDEDNVSLKDKIGAMQTSLDKAETIYDDYINSQNLM